MGQSEYICVLNLRGFFVFERGRVGACQSVHMSHSTNKGVVNGADATISYYYLNNMNGRSYRIECFDGDKVRWTLVNECQE